MSVTININKRDAGSYESLIRGAGLDSIADKLRHGLRYGDVVEVDVTAAVTRPRFLDDLYDLAKEREDRSVMVQVAGLRSLRDGPTSAKLGRKVQPLVVGVAAFMQQGRIDGWLYEKTHDGRMLPWLVTSCTFHKGRDAEERDTVHIVMVANSAQASSFGTGSRGADIVRTSRSFDYTDVQGLTVPEVLATANLFHETPELREVYSADLAAFHEYQPMAGQQFLAWGSAGPVASDFWWRSGRDRRLIDADRPIKIVNDESALTRRHTTIADSSFWNEHGEGFQPEMPYHAYICGFALDSHTQHWFHSSCVRPYEYDPHLRDKLILPPDHRDLIDLLTTDEGGQSDLIAGKGEGTTILCLGPPGTGKTLTAEVYAEVVEKPLYSVHSGQLGITGDKVEASLKVVFARAARWGAVLLIDEADVYIRERDNDTEHNAIVASFLRTLEYFQGLMFMTSNRSDDVDDAILSRATAIIRYGVPEPEVAAEIWRTHAKALGLDQDLISAGLGVKQHLPTLFPRATGRDIRNILALVARVVRGSDRKLDADLLRQAAMFKGVV